MAATESLLRDRVGQDALVTSVVDNIDRFGELRTARTDLLGNSSSNDMRCRRYLNTLRKKFEVSFDRVETDARRSEALSALMGYHDQGLSIRSAIEDGAAEFDLLYGQERDKALWAGDTRQLQQIELFPPHLRGRLHRRTVDAERGMRMLARRFFPRNPCDSNVPPAGAVS